MKVDAMRFSLGRGTPGKEAARGEACQADGKFTPRRAVNHGDLRGSRYSSVYRDGAAICASAHDTSGSQMKLTWFRGSGGLTFS